MMYMAGPKGLDVLGALIIAHLLFADDRLGTSVTDSRPAVVDHD